MSERIAAIIICFHPDREKVGKLVSAIADGVDEILLFDNGGLDAASLPSTGKHKILTRNGQNLGVAAALNLACEAAWQSGCRYAASFDQDSLPDATMIPVLLQELRDRQNQGHPAAAIGPQLVDQRQGTAHLHPFIQITDAGMVEMRFEGTQQVSLLMTSGCVFDLQIWNAIRFEDGLFIDFVDTDWFLRLTAQGYEVLGTTKTCMAHEQSSGIRVVAGFALAQYSPLRRYYQCRNSTWHYFYGPRSRGIRKFLLKNWIMLLMAAVCVDEAPIKSLWQCIRGTFHGVRAKLGPFK